MSIKYLNQAFECAHFTSMEKLLMIALCDAVNDDGYGYPGYKKLMKKTSMAKATLSKHLTILKEAGIFTVESHGEIGEGRKVNTYQINQFWLMDGLHKTLKDSRELHKTSRKVQGVNLSQNDRKVQGVKSSRVEPRKVQGLNPKSSRVEHEPSVLTTSIEPSVISKYSFAGKKIKLNHEDFQKMKSQYSNLDLVDELSQLDMELGQLKNWYITMHKKLNYRNKQAGEQNATYQQNRNQTYADRTNAKVQELLSRSFVSVE